MALKSKTFSFDINGLATEYDLLRKQEKSIAERKTAIANIIKAYSKENGTKTDNGSMYLDTGDFVVGEMKKESISFDSEKTIKFLEKKGFDDAVDVVKVANMKKVEALISSGDITVKEVETIVNRKPSSAVYVKKKDDITEAEKTEVLKNVFSIAAKRKK